MKIVASFLFLLVSIVVSAQNRNFGGPSTTYQMQQNAQRATQSNTFQRQQFDQMNRDRQMQQQMRNQERMRSMRNESTLKPPVDKPKRTKKDRKSRKAKAAKQKDSSTR